MKNFIFFPTNILLQILNKNYKSLISIEITFEFHKKCKKNILILPSLPRPPPLRTNILYIVRLKQNWPIMWVI